MTTNKNEILEPLAPYNMIGQRTHPLILKFYCLMLIITRQGQVLRYLISSYQYNLSSIHTHLKSNYISSTSLIQYLSYDWITFPRTSTTICTILPSTIFHITRKDETFFCWTVSALPLLIWLMLSFYFSWLSTLEWILFYFHFFIYMIYVSIYFIFMKIMNSASMIRWDIFLQVLKSWFFCCWLTFNFRFKPLKKAGDGRFSFWLFHVQETVSFLMI